MGKAASPFDKLTVRRLGDRLAKRPHPEPVEGRGRPLDRVDTRTPDALESPHLFQKDASMTEYHLVSSFT